MHPHYRSRVVCDKTKYTRTKIMREEYLDEIDTLQTKHGLGTISQVELERLQELEEKLSREAEDND